MELVSIVQVVYTSALLLKLEFITNLLVYTRIY